MTNREKAYFRIITGQYFDIIKEPLSWQREITKAKLCAAEEERMIREAFEKAPLLPGKRLDDYLKTIKE